MTNVGGLSKVWTSRARVGRRRPRSSHVAGADVLRVSKEHGLEGVVAKRRASTYQPGRRSPDWIKVKHVRTQEVVVGGWTEGTGHRSASIGALLLGRPGRRRAWSTWARWVPDSATSRWATLARLLKPLARKTSPFGDGLPKAQAAGAHWVTPSVVGEVQFSEWTRERPTPHPSWRGLRPDKDRVGRGARAMRSRVAKMSAGTPPVPAWGRQRRRGAAGPPRRPVLEEQGCPQLVGSQG